MIDPLVRRPSPLRANPLVRRNPLLRITRTSPLGRRKKRKERRVVGPPEGVRGRW